MSEPTRECARCGTTVLLSHYAAHVQADIERERAKAMPNMAVAPPSTEKRSARYRLPGAPSKSERKQRADEVSAAIDAKIAARRRARHQNPAESKREIEVEQTVTKTTARVTETPITDQERMVAWRLDAILKIRDHELQPHTLSDENIAAIAMNAAETTPGAEPKDVARIIKSIAGWAFQGLMADLVIRREIGVLWDGEQCLLKHRPETGAMRGAALAASGAPLR